MVIYLATLLKTGPAGDFGHAGRPRDRNDLEELEALHGELPIDPIPGLDG